jgi:hypothetical protein
MMLFLMISSLIMAMVMVTDPHASIGMQINHGASMMEKVFQNGVSQTTLGVTSNLHV